MISKATYQAVYDDTIMDALAYAKANGFAGIQIAVETPHLSFDNISEWDIFKIAEFRKANKLMLSIHAPDDAASLFTVDKHRKRGMFDYWSALFAYAEILETQIITFHTGSFVKYGTDTDPRSMIPASDEAIYRNAFRENLRRLIDLAAGRFILCLENYKLEPMVMDVICDNLHSGGLSLCWDLAKTYKHPGEIDESLERFFIDSIDYIRQVHLHDLDDKHSHKVVGTGTIDFNRYLSILARADIREYCIEVRPREKALESLVALRQISEGM